MVVVCLLFLARSSARGSVSERVSVCVGHSSWLMGPVWVAVFVAKLASRCRASVCWANSQFLAENLQSSQASYDPSASFL